MTISIAIAALVLCVLHCIQFRRLRAANRRAEQAEQFLRVAPAPILVLDQKGVIKRSNHAAALLFRYSDDRLTGRPISEMLSPQAPEGHTPALEHALHAPAPSCSICTVEGLCDDQTTFPLQLRSRAVNHSGKQWVVLAARDLTTDNRLKLDLERYLNQLVQSREALKRYNTNLEGLVCEQTDRSEAAKVAAEQANAAKSEFLANMSHELRTPLHGILSFARFGIKKHATADRAKLLTYFERIELAGQTLLSLLNALLDLSKLEARAMTLEFKPLTMAELVMNVIEEFTALARERNIQLRLTNIRDAGPVQGDAEKLAQVVRNLLSNALKFTPPGGWIEPAVEETAERVVVTVRDSGPGIPNSECERVFDKFVQSNSTTTGAGGTGLGLAICREIVHLHQGRIAALPTGGKGAMLRLVLPRSPIQAAEEVGDYRRSAVLAVN